MPEHEKELKNGGHPQTLSELIEKCGEDFKELFLIDQKSNDIGLHTESIFHGKWRAVMHKRDTTVWKNTMFSGFTPEEAVTKLLDAINKELLWKNTN